MTSRGHKTEAWNSVRPRGPHAELGPAALADKEREFPKPEDRTERPQPAARLPRLPPAPLCLLIHRTSWLSGRSRGQEILQEAGVVLSMPAQGAHTRVHSQLVCVGARARVCTSRLHAPEGCGGGALSAEVRVRGTDLGLQRDQRTWVRVLREERRKRP